MSAWEKHADVGASPHPPVGEVHVQGEIHPFPRKAPKNGDIDDDLENIPMENIPIVDGDYVIYNRCPVFTYPEAVGAMTHSKRHMGAKKRRVGHVPKIFGNVYKILTGGVVSDLEKVKFMGVAQDGQHNGKDAKNFPESAGRLSVMVHGAVSMIADERYLDNPSFGDYIVVLPYDSGLRINGTENYGVPIVLNVKPGENNLISKADFQESFGDEFEKLLKAMLKKSVLGDLKVEEVKTGTDAMKYVTDFIIGTLLEVTPGENEIRVLLRPHLPITATANTASVSRGAGEVEDSWSEGGELGSKEADSWNEKIETLSETIAKLEVQLGEAIKREASDQELTKLKERIHQQKIERQTAKDTLINIYHQILSGKVRVSGGASASTDEISAHLEESRRQREQRKRTIEAIKNS